MRLNKYLATCGLGSRRKCEQFISDNRVTINGQHVFDLSTIVNEGDVVCVDGRIVKPFEKKIYLMLNKPVCYITACSDDRGRKCVVDLVPSAYGKVFPVGRLDYNTSGLLLLTNDGDLTYKLTHPKHEVDKTYLARVKGRLTKSEIENFKNGLKIEDYVTSKAKLKVIKYDEKKDTSILEIKIHEGKNRQVRKMCKAINHPVLRLKRTAMGKIKIQDCEIGKYRYLTDNEIKYLKNI